MAVSRRVPGVVLCVVALFAAVSPAGAQPYAPLYTGTNATVLDWSNLPAPSPRRIAVLGDVERPGVYESKNPRLVVGDLLTAAGRSNSAGERITRYHSGLASIWVSSWEAGTSFVSHGDILFVSTSPSRRDRAPADVDANIHVGMLGVAAEPVVIPLTPSERTLRALFSKLRQTSAAAAHATVNGIASQQRLENGDIVVVESQWIDRPALEGCLAILPVRSLDEPPAQPAATAIEMSGPATPPVPAESSLLTDPPEIASIPSLPAPYFNEVEMPQTSLLETNPQSTASHSDAAPRVIQPRPLKVTIDAPPLIVDRQRPRSNERAAVRTAQFETMATAVPSVSGLRTLVVLLALGTLGLGVALLWLASERRLRTASPPQPVAMPLEPESEKQPADELGQLVRGELEIEDEPVVLPAHLALHGQATGQKRLIVHPPQALSGPHFTAPAAPVVKATTASDQPAAASRRATASVTSPVRSPKDTEGLLDRVLLAMQREGRQ